MKAKKDVSKPRPVFCIIATEATNIHGYRPGHLLGTYQDEKTAMRCMLTYRGAEVWQFIPNAKANIPERPVEWVPVKEA